MAPVFTPAAVESFLPIFGEVADDLARSWSPDAPVDVARAATAAFAVISRALFTTGLDMPPDETARHVRRMMQAGMALRPSWLMAFSLMDLFSRIGPGVASSEILAKRMRRFLAARRTDPDPPQDFVTRLLKAFAAERSVDEGQRQTLANALTFLVAGHETTASAIAFTLYLLANDPQAQEWAAAEAREAVSAGGPAEALARLTFLRWVLDESLRLYPPAYRVERQAAADDRLGDLAVRKGDLVAVWPWIVHRHEALWDAPERFDPERFAPEAAQGRPRFQYLPFGAGPRICIGAQFATSEALLILAHWLARFRFAPIEGRPLELASDLTLKPKGALPFHVRLR